MVPENLKHQRELPIPTRLSTIGLEPCVDGPSAGWLDSDTANDADK